jgi:epoxyqueuosine reductase QueG
MMTDLSEKNYNLLKEQALSAGASLFGVCKPDYSKQKILDISRDTIKGLDYAVSMGVVLSGKIVKDITDHPTKLYFYHYRQVNYFLDRIALCMTKLIQEKNYGALPIPSSQTVDREKQSGHLSHREVARLSGLGWIGRNNLLVHPRFGAYLRLVTVLTDLPLPVGKPVDADCGDCKDCISACPAGAIKERKEEFDHRRCFQQLDVFRKKYGIGHHICGICVKTCKGKE